MGGGNHSPASGPRHPGFLQPQAPAAAYTPVIRQGGVMNDERKGRKEGFTDGVKQGLGVLSAFKEAIEETINEARERGDLSPERAREAMRAALDRAQEFAGGARERIDLVTRKEFEALKERVEELRARLDRGDGEDRPEP